MPHPSPDELSAFALGRLAVEKCDDVAEHLAQCPPCQETLSQQESQSNTIMAALRNAGPPQPLDPACQRALDAAAKLVSGDSRSVAASQPQRDARLETTASQSPAATLNAPAQQGSPGQSPSRSQPAVTSPPTAKEILTQLIVVQLLSEEQRSTVDTLVASNADGAAIVQQLIARGVVTKFQGQALLQRRGRGLMFGEYVIRNRIGAGGMGQVFQARHRRMDRLVAIKVIASTMMRDAEAVKRFQREVKAAARLSHPHIVGAYDAGEQKGVHFLVMEFVDGHDLSQHIKEHGPLPVTEAVEVVRQAALGLAYAHAEGVVHRDIKPANLLRDKKGHIRILDMGLARWEDPLGKGQDEGLTNSGQMMGTVDYMAPEQAFSTRTAGAAADVYSLGCTLYRLLTGQQLYIGESVVEKVLAHREKPIPPLTMANGEVPAALAQLFTRMVAKEATSRPTMAEVVTELEKIKLPTAQYPSVNVGVTNAKTAVRRPPRRPTPLVWVLAAAAGFSLFAAGVWVIVKDKSGKEVGRLKVPDGGSATIQEGDPRSKMPNISTRTQPPAIVTPAPSPNEKTSPQVDGTKQFMLEFDGQSHVEIPGYEDDGTTPLTFEARLTDGLDQPYTSRINLAGLFYASTPTESGYVRTAIYLGEYDVDLTKYNPKIQVSRGGTPGATIRYLQSTMRPRSSELIDLAVVFDDRFGSIFVNGKNVNHSKFDNSIYPNALGRITSIGASSAGIVNYRGFIQQIRISKTARYKADYTPARALEPDADTYVLYKFDEGTGDVLKDSSGNGLHGKIVGAKWVGAKSSDLATSVAHATRDDSVSSITKQPVTTRAPSLPSNSAGPYAIEFDKNGYIEIPDFNLDYHTPLTFEARLTDEDQQRPNDSSSAHVFDSLTGTGNSRCRTQVALVAWNVELTRLNPEFHVHRGSSPTVPRMIYMSKKHAKSADFIDLAVVFSESKATIFVNGLAFTESSFELGQYDVSGSEAHTRIGALSTTDMTKLRGYRGYIQQVRISKSARYGANYVPAKTLEQDADTYVLYKFDEGTGDVLRDSS